MKSLKLTYYIFWLFWKNVNLQLFSDVSSPSLLKFLGVELTRGYILEHDEEQYTARREKVYTFVKIPIETEKFMAYGFFQVRFKECSFFTTKINPENPIGKGKEECQ